jgi:threonine aldolase
MRHAMAEVVVGDDVYIDDPTVRLLEERTAAASFARTIASYPEVDIDPATVETNIVRFRLRGIPAGEFVEEAHRLGVHMLPSGPNAVRAVFYLDITDFDAERASELVGEGLHSLERHPEETLSTTTSTSAQY